MSRLEVALAVAAFALLVGAGFLVTWSIANETRRSAILDCYDRANTPMQLSVCRGIRRDVTFVK